MSFLTPEQQRARAGHDAPYRARGGEDALALGIEGDPRRVIAIVAPRGAGSSRLALEIASRAPRAYFLEGDGEPEELEALLADAGPGRPILVLDGERARRKLAEFVRAVVHPRLAILVPSAPASAPRVPVLAGLPRASIAVVALEGEGSASSEPPDDLADLLLATDGNPDDEQLARFLATDDPERLDASSLAAMAIPISHRVLEKMADRAESLLARAEGERAAALHEILARETARRGEDARERLLSALAATSSRTRRARLVAALGTIDRDDARFAEALGMIEEPAARASVLVRWSRALELDDRTDEALARTEEAIALEEAAGSRLGAGRARMRVAHLLRNGSSADRALDFALRARGDFQSVGDAGDEARALQFVATVLLDAGRFEDAAARAREALSLAEAIGDAASIGWARFALGASADRAADPAAARAHYEAGIAALREAGLPIPARLADALAITRKILGGDPGEPSPDADPSLISISRRRS